MRIKTNQIPLIPHPQLVSNFSASLQTQVQPHSPQGNLAYISTIPAPSQITTDFYDQTSSCITQPFSNVQILSHPFPPDIAFLLLQSYTLLVIFLFLWFSLLTPKAEPKVRTGVQVVDVKGDPSGQVLGT